jgi:hypothetical protein
MLLRLGVGDVGGVEIMGFVTDTLAVVVIMCGVILWSVGSLQCHLDIDGEPHSIEFFMGDREERRG